jgi:hypothetical protein
MMDTPKDLYMIYKSRIGLFVHHFDRFSMMPDTLSQSPSDHTWVAVKEFAPSIKDILKFSNTLSHHIKLLEEIPINERTSTEKKQWQSYKQALDEIMSIIG